MKPAVEGDERAAEIARIKAAAAAAAAKKAAEEEVVDVDEEGEEEAVDGEDDGDEDAEDDGDEEEEDDGGDDDDDDDEEGSTALRAREGIGVDSRAAGAPIVLGARWPSRRPRRFGDGEAVWRRRGGEGSGSRPCSPCCCISRR